MPYFENFRPHPWGWGKFFYPPMLRNFSCRFQKRIVYGGSYAANMSNDGGAEKWMFSEPTSNFSVQLCTRNHSGQFKVFKLMLFFENLSIQEQFDSQRIFPF